MPGVPDVYQGTELWEDSLVDPDNRRPVDFDARRALLDRARRGDRRRRRSTPDGAAKLWVVSRALRLRRDWPDLFASYTPLRADGPAAEHAVAFDRGGAITVATRLPVGLERGRRLGRHDARPRPRGDRRDLRAPRRRARSRWPTCSPTYPVALLVR